MHVGRDRMVEQLLVVEPRVWRSHDVEVTEAGCQREQASGSKRPGIKWWQPADRRALDIFAYSIAWAGDPAGQLGSYGGVVAATA